jgi:iron-sulfur cluster assembly protein
MCKTRSQSYFAEPPNGIAELSRQHAGWCEQHARAPLFVVIYDAFRYCVGSATILVAVAGMLPAISGPTRRLDRHCSTPDFSPMDVATPSINYKIGNERLISVTENAARKLASLLEEKGQPEGALRLKVIGGGCSGLQYVMDLVDGPMQRDILVPTQNVRLVVDPKSALFVSGSVLDYSEDLQKGGFKVTNPNAVAHCSCGESFAV